MKITKGEQMLMYDLNIITILKKMIEFEKFKEILFNKQQIDLMKVLQIRKIDSFLEVDEFLKNKLFNMNCDEIKVAEELSSAYDYCFCSVNALDHRILKNLHFNK